MLRQNWVIQLLGYLPIHVLSSVLLYFTPLLEKTTVSFIMMYSVMCILYSTVEEMLLTPPVHPLLWCFYQMISMHAVFFLPIQRTSIGFAVRCHELRMWSGYVHGLLMHLVSVYSATNCSLEAGFSSFILLQYLLFRLQGFFH